MQNPVSDEQRDWERDCAPAITSDVIWKLDAYRAALFLLHLARRDCDRLRIARPNEAITSQLVRAAGSVGANLGEGYSRATRNDRLRFLGYSLGSARECLIWYEASRGVLQDDVINDRLRLLTRLRALLLGLIRSLRATGA